MNAHRKKPIVNIGRQVPSNLKFGIIVVLGTFWAQFVRSLLNEVFAWFHITLPVLTDLIVAVAATIAAYGVLQGYRRITAKLKKTAV